VICAGAERTAWMTTLTVTHATLSSMRYSVLLLQLTQQGWFY